MGPRGLLKKPMNILAKFTNYLRSAKTELQKVTWPTREETLRYSALVIGVTIFTAAFFASLDFGLSKGIDLLIQNRTNTAVAPQNLPPATTPVVPDVSPSGVDARDINGLPTNDFTVQKLPDSATSPAVPSAQ